jgi:DNA helicase-2/ATP-dependent DNA helicase PcrA
MTTLSQQLRSLNDAQREAVLAPIGPTLVRAGAGAGKTRVLTLRIAHLIEIERAAPKSILAVTFTNKAASELKTRLKATLGNGARGASTGTFHRICLDILREHIEGHLGSYTRSFSIYGADDQLMVVQRAMDASTARPPALVEAPQVLHTISRFKSRLLTPLQATRSAGGDPLAAYAAGIYVGYQRILTDSNAIDFDDCIVLTHRLLERNEDVLARCQERWRHVLVDEFQDTDPAQSQLLHRLTERLDGLPRSLFAVGDVQQAIYSFRNADHRIMSRFPETYPGARIIELRTNYRSRQEILNAAFAVIQHSRAVAPMPLEAGSGLPRLVPPVQFSVAKDGRAEADDVTKTIAELVASGRRRSDIAVLFRTRHMSREIETACRRRRIPYVIRGTASFYDRRVVRDMLAYLRAVANPADAISFNRMLSTPPRGIGDATRLHLANVARELDLSATEVVSRPEALVGLGAKAAAAVRTFGSQVARWRRFAESLSPDHLLADIIEQTGYLKMLDDQLEPDDRRDAEEHLKELQAAAEPHDSLGDFLHEIALMTHASDDEERDAVQLLTIHAAKGLEWPVVFVLGMEEGTLPHERSIGNAAGLEEERRLCYVAITRAAQQVYLSRAESRGKGKALKPSRFLEEIIAYGASLKGKG